MVETPKLAHGHQEGETRTWSPQLGDMGGSVRHWTRTARKALLSVASQDVQGAPEGRRREDPTLRGSCVCVCVCLVIEKGARGHPDGYRLFPFLPPPPQGISRRPDWSPSVDRERWRGTPSQKDLCVFHREVMVKVRTGRGK